MKMRVSIARALVDRPNLLLLDEPFAALDEITRWQLNDALLDLRRESGATIVFVTHSVYESAYLADRVAIMRSRPGRIDSVLTLERGGGARAGVAPQRRLRGGLRADRGGTATRDGAAGVNAFLTASRPFWRLWACSGCGRRRCALFDIPRDAIAGAEPDRQDLVDNAPQLLAATADHLARGPGGAGAGGLRRRGSGPAVRLVALAGKDLSALGHRASGDAADRHRAAAAGLSGSPRRRCWPAPFSSPSSRFCPTPRPGSRRRTAA